MSIQYTPSPGDRARRLPSGRGLCRFDGLQGGVEAVDGPDVRVIECGGFPLEDHSMIALIPPLSPRRVTTGARNDRASEKSRGDTKIGSRRLAGGERHEDREYPILVLGCYGYQRASRRCRPPYEDGPRRSCGLASLTVRRRPSNSC